MFNHDLMKFYLRRVRRIATPQCDHSQPAVTPAAPGLCVTVKTEHVTGSVEEANIVFTHFDTWM